MTMCFITIDLGGTITKISFLRNDRIVCFLTIASHMDASLVS